MRLHYLQHVHFEGPAAIEDWANEAGYSVAGSHLYRGDPLPEPDAFDLLVIMGGPMSVNDEREYPWLVEEKQLVRAAMEANRAILGVCLGAQMIASATGARVYRGPEKEIGWFPVRRVTDEGAGALLPETFTPLHWHRETFDLPPGAVRLAETEVIPNQAFQLGSHVIGLQFHVEATPQSVGMLVEHAGHEIQAGRRFQQAPQVIVAQAPSASEAVRPVLGKLLQYLTRPN
jgi:GMP synthase-like glutamine amidotransferase